MAQLKLEDARVAVIGLGYVGLPLAVEFGKHREIIGFDVDVNRVKSLSDGFDATNEISPDDLKSSWGLSFTSSRDDLIGLDVYIVAVPTPIDDNNTPDMTPLRKASEMLSSVLGEGALVIYESTVYPGATEEFCVPILASGSGLVLNKGFYVGYSPERINPGDKENTLTKITKITSGSNSEVAKFVDKLYSSVITAGTHMASSIKVAEAAKVIENTQRDLNIAVVNEFAKIFNLIGIDTQEVLEAAGTKWNFMPFKPGLVGGHCISVDPYYLTYKAKEVGYQPEVILSGRRINDGMAQYVATQLLKTLSRRNIPMNQARILVLGFTFKGDCPDVRNTKIIQVVHELESFNIRVDVFDSWACPLQVREEYGLTLCKHPEARTYDAIVLAVDHSEFREWGEKRIREFGKSKHVLYDVKHVLRLGQSDLRL